MARKILLVFLIFGVTTTAWAQGDRWPWSWGTECPFPWKRVEGNYKVNDLQEAGKYHGHRIEIEVEDSSSRKKAKLLKLIQFNEREKMVATGEGVSEGEGKVITAYMNPVRAGRAYKIMVRAYDRNLAYVSTEPTRCSARNRILAVTFCSIRGRKCMEDSNYVLKIVQ